MTMEIITATARLFALAQAGRLETFRLLVAAGPQGLAAGEIARRLAIAPNTLSARLNLLSQAGLVRSQRLGRSIVYAADFSAVQDLLAFLVEDCCEGRPEVCAPLAGVLERIACCPPTARP